MGKARSEFADYLLELLEPWGGVSARAMFGGFALYKDGVIFALIAEDTLYIKTDADNRERFTEAGLLPFTYTHKNRDKPSQMPYHQAPGDALEDPDTLREWAQLGYEAGLRAGAKASP